MNRTEYEADICSRLRQSERIPFKQVSIGDWRPQMAQCHQNVDTWVKANTGAVAVRGWVTLGGDGYTMRLTAHSVVKEPNGGLVDITPLGNENDRQGMLFIQHVGCDEAFSKAKKENLYIDCPLSVRVSSDEPARPYQLTQSPGAGRRRRRARLDVLSRILRG
jgi:hypothetical protein